MKRILALVVLIAMLVTGVFSLASCSRNKTPGKATYDVPEGGYDGSAVTIVFWHSMGANLQDVLNNNIEKFNEMYPNITVEHASMGDYDGVRDQVKTALTAGNQPNIAYCYPDHVALYNVAKKVIPLDNLIESKIEVTDALGNTTVLGFTDEQLADFVPGYYAEGSVFDEAGTMYTLPMSKSTEALYYNKTFFEYCLALYNSPYDIDYYTHEVIYEVEVDKDGNTVYEVELDENGEAKVDKDGKPVYALDDNGQKIPVYKLDENGEKIPVVNAHYKDENYNITLPTTWDEMESVCKKIKAIDPGCVPLGYDSEANWFITMTEQLNSGYTSLDEDEHFLFNNDANANFIKRYHEWYKNGYLTTETIYGSYTSGLFTATGNDQKCYMVIGSTGGASYQTPPVDSNGKPLFEAGMATIPQEDPNNPQVISQGPSLCILDSESDQEIVASWLFVKFLTSNVAFQAAFSMKSGYAPVIKSVQDNAVYSAWLDKASGYDNMTALSVKLALSQSDAYFVSPAFNGSSVARDEVGGVLADCLVYSGSDVEAYIRQKLQEAIDECEYNV